MRLTKCDTARVMMRGWRFIGFRQFVRKALLDYLEFGSNYSLVHASS